MARIVHLANFFGPRSGGLRTMMMRLSQGYAEAGHDVHLVVPRYPISWGSGDGITVHTLPSVAIPGSGGYRLISSSRLIHHLLDDLTPDVVELSDRTTLVAAARWARKADVPCVLFAHERVDGVINAFAPLLPSTSIADQINRRIGRLVTTVIATTHFAAQEFARVDIPTQRISLGVDCSVFSPETSPPSRTHTPLVLCSRLSKEKNPGFVLDVMRAGIDSGRSWTLDVLGDGPLLSQLRRAARDLPVTFHGFVSERAVVAHTFANSAVCLAPGPIETFGLAALESLASGTPVVCMKSSAIPEVVGDAGIHADADVEQWVRAIDQIAHPSAQAFRSRARRRAMEFPWHSMVDSMLDLHQLHRVTAEQPIARVPSESWAA